MGFKDRYHGDLAKSSEYAAREAEAKALLVRNLGKLGIVVLDGDPSYVANQGKIEGHPEVRFDYSLWYPIRSVVDHRSVLLGYVEVTGDRLDDDYLYILSEKVAKARKVDVPVWFLYYKERKRKRVVIRAQSVVRYGTLINWVQGERPYYRVSISRAVALKTWLSWWRSIIPLINEGRWFEVKQSLIRW
jgi:hypothetical protein